MFRRPIQRWQAHPATQGQRPSRTTSPGVLSEGIARVEPVAAPLGVSLRSMRRWRLSAPPGRRLREKPMINSQPFHIAMVAGDGFAANAFHGSFLKT